MRHSSKLLVLAASVLLLSSVKAEARQIRNPGPGGVPAAAKGKTEGILTDRLSQGDLSLWKSIVSVVFAKDKTGRLKNPKLFGIWQQVDTSGHAVYVELISREKAFGSQAGRFKIETPDPSGKRHIASIRLNLPAIERAATGEAARREDGCLPLAGLGNKERFAEVLGHELAHAATVLEGGRFWRMYEDLDRETGEYERCLAGPDRKLDELELRLDKIQRLLREFERPAQSAELEIWRELLNRAPVAKNQN